MIEITSGVERIESARFRTLPILRTIAWRGFTVVRIDQPPSAEHVAFRFTEQISRTVAPSETFKEELPVDYVLCRAQPETSALLRENILGGIFEGVAPDAFQARAGVEWQARLVF